MLNKSQREKVRYVHAYPRRKKQDTKVLGLYQERKQKHISTSKAFSKYKMLAIFTCKLRFRFVES